MQKEVPWRYDFLNPLTVEVIGGDLAVFAGSPEFGLNISTKIKNLIQKSKESIQLLLISYRQIW